MKKLIISAIAIAATATSALGGSLTFDEPVEQETITEEPAMMGSSGGWIIPLLVIAAIVLIVSNDDDPQTPPTKGGN